MCSVQLLSRVLSIAITEPFEPQNRREGKERRRGRVAER